MAVTGMGYREVPYVPPCCARWREITVTTGGNAGLSDVKLPDSAGGYGYTDSSRVNSNVRNRFIYWRSSKDCLELIEDSLDINLQGNCVRFRFYECLILPGISIHEAHGEVVILVSTVSSVHRLIFPHPIKLQKHVSIFADASVATVRNPSNSHAINSSSGVTYSVHISASWLTTEGEALFGLATNTGSIILVKLPPHGIQGIVTQQELKQSSMMQRLWTGIMPSMIMRGEQESADSVTSLCLHPVEQDTIIYAVCRDNKLRLWSCKRLECVMVCNLLDYVPDNIDPQRIVATGQGHLIRKAWSNADDTLYLAVYLSFGDRCQFCVFEPVFADGQYQMSHVSSVFAPNETLVDFCLKFDHLLTLWTNADSEPVLRYSSIDSGGGTDNWKQSFLEPPLPGDIDIPPHLDPREAFIQQIFHPGRFSLEVVSKALNIYRRSLDTTLPIDVPVEYMKEQVTKAVENEIHNAASEYEVSEEEYCQLQLQQWSKFYSGCAQYQEVGTKPIGLFCDNSTGMVCLVKKNLISFVRPCDVLEYLYLSPIYQCPAEEFSKKIKSEIAGLNEIISLVDCTKLLSQLLTAEIVYEFEHSLFHGEIPDDLAQMIVNLLLPDAGDHNLNQIIMDIQAQIQNITNLEKVFETLLRLTDMAKGNPEGLNTEDITLEASSQVVVNHLFSSETCVSVISSSFAQMADSRFGLLRDLLLLQCLLVRLGEQVGVNVQLSEHLRSDIIPQTRPLLMSYFLLKWASQTINSPLQPDIIESNLLQLDALEITETGDGGPSPKAENYSTSLAQLFLRGNGGQQLRILLAQSGFLEEDPCSFFSNVFQAASVMIGQLIWPVSVNFVFPEFLMAKCQYMQLQSYSRLLQNWCEWNAGSRRFLLGQSYLNFNEPQKALDCFLEAVHGVRNEDFFVNKLLQTEETMPRILEMLYYLKVIRLFEQFSLPQLVISLATTAIAIYDGEDENVATLWSKVFKYRLELGHNEEAYAAMIANPDPSRRKDCLRQLVVVLCERNQLQTLVEFPYIDLHDEVVSIIESRARSVDLATHNYYDLLYAFHIFRANFRKAGSVMYEYGMRLGYELPGLKGLQRQAKCYLAALNVLRLGNPDYAWIVRPVPSTKAILEEHPGMSPKRMFDGEEKEQLSDTQKLDVLDLQDIEKEYMLVHARLNLLRKDPELVLATGPTLSESETVGLLVNAGLFDNAVTLCKAFDHPLNQVFEGLALRCIKLAQGSAYFMRGDNENTAKAWTWLTENEIGSSHLNKEISSADQAWRLLQIYLEKYEDNTSKYHRCVSQKLLSHGFNLPNWFTASYKAINAPELLRLYLDYDLLEEAAVFTMEYIDAVMGKGGEYFGLKTSLHYPAPCVWLPYTSIDQLLLALSHVSTSAECIELYKYLQEKLCQYHQLVKKVSEDMINATVTRQLQQ